MARSREERQDLRSIGSIDILSQSSASVTATTEDTYTVTDPDARQVLLFFNGSLGDFTVNFGATADANSLPLLNNEYVVLSAEEGEVIHTFNTTAGAITIHYVELA